MECGLDGLIGGSLSNSITSHFDFLQDHLFGFASIVVGRVVCVGGASCNGVILLGRIQESIEANEGSNCENDRESGKNNTVNRDTRN